MKINVPNQITIARLILAVIFFVLLSLFSAEGYPGNGWLLKVCFWVFLVAAATDFLDGLLARMLKQVTIFGRVVDPVVDKVLVCGAFIYFASDHFVAGGKNVSFVAPWMATVIIGRELFVSALRAHSEAEGRDFSAVWIGKLKMVVQSTAVCLVLGYLAWFPGLAPVAKFSVWLTVVITIVSMITYGRRAWTFLRSSAAPAEKAGPLPSSAAPAPAQERLAPRQPDLTEPNR